MRTLMFRTFAAFTAFVVVVGRSHATAPPPKLVVILMFMGPGIKPGWYDQPATPADVAPTLAALYGVTLPHAEGHALRAAL
jgi:hypothetical protein